jgi:hypothetical protein
MAHLINPSLGPGNPDKTLQRLTLEDIGQAYLQANRALTKFQQKNTLLNVSQTNVIWYEIEGLTFGYGNPPVNPVGATQKGNRSHNNSRDANSLNYADAVNQVKITKNIWLNIPSSEKTYAQVAKDGYHVTLYPDGVDLGLRSPAIHIQLATATPFNGRNKEFVVTYSSIGGRIDQKYNRNDMLVFAATSLKELVQAPTGMASPMQR